MRERLCVNIDVSAAGKVCSCRSELQRCCGKVAADYS